MKCCAAKLSGNPHRYLVASVYGATCFVVFSSLSIYFGCSPLCEDSHASETNIESGTGSGADDRGDIDIWGVAAIATFLWESIFDSRLEPSLNDTIFFGKTIVNTRTVILRMGPGILEPFSLSASLAKHQILVINGRTGAKTTEAAEWLDRMKRREDVEFLTVVLLGTEMCENDWIMRRLKKHGSFIDTLFLVYDNESVDVESVYQWPLGPAT